jgi:hypothetical protein
VALLAALLITVPVSAQLQLPRERLIEVARSIGEGLIGLSPGGAEIYARRAVTFAGANRVRFDELAQLRVAFGEELARDAPNRKHLSMITDRIAREEARQARLKGNELISTAFALPEDDRRKLGQAIARNMGSEFALP